MPVADRGGKVAACVRDEFFGVGKQVQKVQMPLRSYDIRERIGFYTQARRMQSRDAIMFKKCKIPKHPWTGTGIQYVRQYANITLAGL